ncbi:MAG: ferredoxin--NADP reductase [Sphingobacteriales bacterium]|nr:MAG: ferredoxin--NADP reductase [Sphingobacteriales bacterium]
MIERPAAASIFQRVTITSIRQETEDVKTFTLAPEDGTELTYQAGQFITFVAYHAGKEERRSYSFSSSPLLNEVPAITVKRVDNGFFSRYLIDEAQPGDQLDTIGASGFFTLPDDVANYKQLFFFAAGVGITPIISIIKTALQTHPNINVTLVYSNSNIASTVFYAELQQLEAKYLRLKIVYLFSDAKNLMKARLSKWMVPELLNKELMAGKEETLFYLCGPFAYMRTVVLSLEEYGVPAANIRKENFNTSLAVLKQVPPDTDAHEVTIELNGTKYQFPSQYPSTILQSAKDRGLNLPYSCSTGRCGTCAAHCTAGKVWHSYNEVLTDVELDSGIVLTCTAYPIGGDVTIQF